MDPNTHTQNNKSEVRIVTHNYTQVTTHTYKRTQTNKPNHRAKLQRRRKYQTLGNTITHSHTQNNKPKA